MFATRVAAALAITAGIAQAQSVSDPDTLPEETELPEAGEYPSALIDRALILPAGMLEGGLALTLGSTDLRIVTDTRMRVVPSARIAVGAVELEAGVELIAHASRAAVDLETAERLAAVSASMRYLFAPGMTVGLQLAVLGLAADPTTVIPRLVLGRKQLMTDRIALESMFAPGVLRTGNPDQDVTKFVATGQLRVQYQAADAIAVEARAALTVFHGTMAGTTLVHDYGVRVVTALTPMLDIAPGFDLLVDQGTMAWLVTARIAARTRY